MAAILSSGSIDENVFPEGPQSFPIDLLTISSYFPLGTLWPLSALPSEENTVETNVDRQETLTYFCVFAHTFLRLIQICVTSCFPQSVFCCLGDPSSGILII